MNNIVQRLKHGGRADIDEVIGHLHPHTRSSEFSGIRWYWKVGGPDYKFSDEAAWIEYVPAPKQSTDCPYRDPLCDVRTKLCNDCACYGLGV